MERCTLSSLFVIALLAVNNYAAPTDSAQSLVVTSTEPSDHQEPGKEDVSTEVPPKAPKIYQMHVQSAVSNRYANTTITSKVKNIASQPQEATFSVVLPETAFISGFVMEVDGKNYTAYVKEKEEAKKAYDEAVASGLGAAHVAVSARDSNRFTVSVNVEPESKAAFYLNYEELLKREDGHYELVINLHPGQPVKDLSVEVVITESRRISDLKAPPIRSGNEIGNEKSELDPRADLEIINDKSAVVKFSPNLERQKQLAHLLGTDDSQGLAGQFVVQYDVERDPNGGEVLVQDGYFVHFFAPSDIKPLPKHIVFILDTSYSMVGEKIEQLREAMSKIMGQLKEEDLFNLVEFNTNVKVWDLNNASASVWFPTENEDSWRNEEPDEDITKYTFPSAYAANADNIKKAIATVSELEPNGGTDIHNGLTVGLHLIEMANKHNKDKSAPQPMIVFLTDGDPTIGVTAPEEIISKISEFNSGSRRSPIFALSFGDGADKNFLQKLALRNSGFSRHIYEAADASLQLQDFYQQISSPLLANVTFKYEPSVTSLTKTAFPIHFGGSEIVVSGWCGTGLVNPEVEGWGVDGRIHFSPVVERPVSNVERLWAYLTVKQLLEKKEASDKDQEELKKKALDLALKYSFVTPVSSLVVVKPNNTNAVDTEAAVKGQRHIPYAQSLAAPGGVPLSGVVALKYADSDFASFGGRYAFAEESEAIDLRVQEPEESYTESLPELIEATTTVPVVETTKSAGILVALPWLKDALSENGSLKLPTGEYKLGLNTTLTDVVDCPKTPLNAAGHCSLLSACTQVYSLLTTFESFVQHSCILNNEYAGICCPSASNNP